MAKQKKGAKHSPKPEKKRTAKNTETKTVVENRPAYNSAAWFALSFLLFLSAAFASWQLLRAQDFNYPYWYEALNIEEFIQEYGKDNIYRDDFEFTSQAERVRLFCEIVTTIHNSGKGLADIEYFLPEQNTARDTLLRKPEVVHLQDVANLIDLLFTTAWAAVGLAIAGILWAWRTKLAPPNWRRLVLSWLGLTAVCTGLIAAIGAKKVFYQLHVWIFPDDHQWFFYYQESLMTTLMKAPDIFAYITTVWALVTLVLLFLSLTILSRLLKNNATARA